MLMHNIENRLNDRSGVFQWWQIFHYCFCNSMKAITQNTILKLEKGNGNKTHTHTHIDSMRVDNKMKLKKNCCEIERYVIGFN